jgi:membrane protease YdiL (CAAX protease family)
MWNRWVALVGASFVVAGAAAGAMRVATLEGEELEHVTGWETLGARQAQEGPEESVRLTEVSLAAGEHAVFELCSGDALEAARWQGLVEVAVWRPAEQDVLVRTPFDAEHLALAKRSPGGDACLPLGEGEVPHTGAYAIDLVWTGGPPGPELLAVPLQVRVLARRPLGPLDRVPVLLTLFGALIAVVVLGVSRPPSGALTTSSRRAAAVRLGLGVLAVLLGAIAIAHLPIAGGSTMGLVRGLVFAGIEIGVALALVQPAHPLAGGRVMSLGLVRPVLWFPRRRPRPSPAGPLAPPPPPEPEPRPSRVPAALVYAGIGIPAGLVLALLAKVSITVVQPTSEAPIQTFVSWPSGLLSFATLAVVVPLAEELFFRGFVYGVASRFGTAFAFSASLLLFVAAHAPQTWGAWGGLIAVAMAGTVLTGLRAWTGSTVVPACAHLVYNGVLATTALW